MERDILHLIFGVSKSYRAGTATVAHDAVFIPVYPLKQRFRCPNCKGRKVIRQGKRLRRVQTLSIGFNPVYLAVEVPRCLCHECNYVFELHPPFANGIVTIPKSSCALSMD